MSRGVVVGSAAVALLVLCSWAHAGILHFTNPAPGQPGHYDWHWEPAASWSSWLDITLGPGQQSNKFNGSSIGQLSSGGPINWHGGGASVASTTQSIQPATFALVYGAVLYGLEYNTASWHATTLEPSFFPENQARYIGVVTVGGNYGWIEARRQGLNLTALAWAYETGSGVPIYAGQIPTPGALPFLGALLVLPRKRRVLSRGAS